MSFLGPGSVEQIGVDVVAKTGNFFRQVDGAVDKAQGKMNQLGGFIGKALVAGAAVGGAAIAGLGVVAVKMGLDFEAVMSNIETQTNIPKESIKGLTAEIMALSKELGIAPTELAASAYFVLSAGFQEAADAANVLRAAAELSTIGLGSTDVVARALTQTLVAYGEGSDQANKYADIFLGTVKAGAAEADELAGSLSNVVPFAAQLGVKFPVVAGALAQMTNKGFSLSEAATALNQLFTQLISPSEDLTDALGAMGYTTDGLIKGLQTDALGTLTAIAKGAEESGQTVTLFADNVRAARAFVGAFGADSAETAKLVAQLSDAEALAAGRAESLAVKQEKASFKLKKATNLVRVELTELGLKALPLVALGLDFLLDNVDKVSRFIKSNMTPALVGLGAALVVAAALAAPWAAAMVIGFLPILAGVAAVAALSAAFFLLEKKTGFFSKVALPALKKAAKAVLPQLKEFARTAIDMGQSLIRFLAPSLDTLHDLWVNLRGPLTQAGEAFLSIAGVIGSALLPPLKAMGEFLLEHKPLLIAIAAAILLLVAPWLAVVAAIAVVLAKWDEISHFFTQTIPAAIDSLIAKIREIPVLGQVFDVLVNIAKDKIGAVIAIFQGLIDFAGTLISFFKNIFSGEWGAAWEDLKELAVIALNLLLDFLQLTFIGTVKSILDTLIPWNWVKTAFGDFKTKAIGAFQDVINFFEGIPGELDKLQSSFTTAATTLGQKLLAGLVDGVVGGAGLAADIATKVGNAIIDFVNTKVIDKINRALEFDIKGPFGLGTVHLNPPDIPNIPRREHGGPVRAGELYQVNEAGIEYFRPQTAGEVIPLTQMAPAAGGGGGGGITNYGRWIQVYGPGRRTADVLRDMDRMVR